MFQVFYKYLITLIFINIVVTASAESLLTTEKDGSVYSPNITPSDSNAENEESPDFMHGTLASFSVTVFSELGDKTFFLAAILAMKQSRMQVFIGALSALAPMTVLSVIFGMAASVVPKFFMQFVSSLLLAIFGFNMLKEGITMTPEESLQEFEKCKKDLDSSNGKADKCFAMTQAFTLTLLGELGDRSQIATILLATTENACGVALGGILGHAMCTAAAVLGGRLLAHNIPVKTMTTVGGIVFLIFALTTWMF